MSFLRAILHARAKWSLIVTMLLHDKDIMSCRKKVLVQGKINKKLIVVLEWGS